MDCCCEIRPRSERQVGGDVIVVGDEFDRADTAGQ
jgi:hypothetical protein